MTRDNGLYIRIGSPAMADGIAKELKDIIIHKPASPPDTIRLVMMMHPPAAVQEMFLSGTVRDLA